MAYHLCRLRHLSDPGNARRPIPQVRLVGKYIQSLPDYWHFLCRWQRHDSNLSCGDYGIYFWRHGAGNLVGQLTGILEERS